MTWLYNFDLACMKQQQRHWLAIALSLCVFGSATHAATFTVTHTGDSGAGSLRQAIADAEGLAGPDVITFDPALDGQTLVPTTVGDTTYGNTAFRITTDITIAGSSSVRTTLSGGQVLRLFYVAPGGALSLVDLTVANGQHQGGNGGEGRVFAGGGGGGPGMGGAIFVEGNLNVSRALFAGNVARGGQGGGYAAGIVNGGGGGANMLGHGADSPADGVGGAGAVGNGTVGAGGNGGNNGQTGAAAGGFGAGGGGGGSIELDGNAGGFGGGGGGGRISTSVVTGLGGFGGGNGTGVGAAGGRGAGLGGAIMNNGGTVTVSNSSFTNNTAAYGTSGGTTGALGAGGAIFSRNGSLTLVNVTLSANTALQGGRSVYALGDGGTASVTLYNSIAGQAAAGAAELVGNAIHGGATSWSGDHNIVRQSAAVTGLTFSNVDPLLGALADNGGPSQTLKPTFASPAKNAGDNNQTGGATLDQRGQARIFDDDADTVDLGAVELDNVAPTDVLLSPATVPENQPVGTPVGSLTSTDADSGDSHTYTLVAGTGDTDNAAFTIVGGSLQTAAIFDFESRSSYSVRVQTTDAGGLSFEQVLTIGVTDVYDLISGPVAGSETASASLGQGAWVFAPNGTGPLESSGFIGVTGHPKSPPSLPPGYSFPYGLFDFVLTAGTAGTSATVVLTFPQPLPADTVYWKYGPEPGNSAPHWYVFPAVINGNTITLTIVDGQQGDDDLSANSIIVDQGGPGVPSAPANLTGIPTLSEWGMLLMAALMLLLAARRTRWTRPGM